MSDTPEVPKPLLDKDTYTAAAATDPRVTHRAMTQAEEVAIAALKEKGEEGGEAPTAAPVNVDVPYASQEGTTLSCTMGNWEGEPTSYAYQWYVDGANLGVAETITVVPDDVGKSAVCIVTATNAVGSTDAPESNVVVIA